MGVNHGYYSHQDKMFNVMEGREVKNVKTKLKERKLRIILIGQWASKQKDME
jgi:hypothetical protein